MEPITVQYEDPVRQHMQKFILTETAKMWNIEVPGMPATEATDTEPATHGTETKLWSFPREVLARVFPHKRDDRAAMFDFVQGAWTYAKHFDNVGKDSIVKPDEESVKISAVCAKLAGTLLTALDIDTYRQFVELSLTVDSMTTAGSVRAQEKAAAKAAKDAEKQAERDKKKDEKKAEREAERKKKIEEKKAEKEKAAAEKKAAKEAEKPKKPNKAERQAAMGAAAKAEKAPAATAEKATAKKKAAKAESAKPEAAPADAHPGGDWNAPVTPITPDEPKPSADDLLDD